MNTTERDIGLINSFCSALVVIAASVGQNASAQSQPPSSAIAIGPTAVSGSAVSPTLAKGYSAMKAWPNSAHELLSNLKLALDQDWLLQPSFYEEQNLREFFGARERFGIIPPNPQRLGFSINSSSYVKEQKRFSSEQLHTMSYFDQTDGTIEGSTGVTSVGKKFGSIYLYLREASIPFSEVERIFGSSWKFNPPNYPPSPHRILLPITHPLGMKYMLFDLNTLSHTKHIRIETHENGALSHFQIQIQEK